MTWLRDGLRTVLTAAGGVMATILAAVAAILAARGRGPQNPAVERVIDLWSRVWLRLAGVRLEVIGVENVDPDRSYVVVANHVSTLDIMACFRALPIPIRFLAKKELFRIPLLAPAMRAIGIVEVDRQARVAVHEQLNAQAKELIASGSSVIIYPEGTRSRDGSLGSFKKGAFTIASALGLPVLPVAIHGSFEAWPPGSSLVRGGVITVAIEPPLEAPEKADATRLRDTARDVIDVRLRSLAQS